MFVTKYRKKVFTDELLAECESIMSSVCDDFDVVLEEFGGESDHVHLLVSIPPTVAVSKLVNSLKGVSSRLLRKKNSVHFSKTLWNGILWSRSYYCGTAGGAPLETLRSYIQNQGN